MSNYDPSKFEPVTDSGYDMTKIVPLGEEEELETSKGTKYDPETMEWYPWEIETYDVHRELYKPTAETLKEDIEKGTIRQTPWKPWFFHVGSIAKEMIPFKHFMTENGRALYESLPEPAKSDKNFLEFTKALDWMLIALTPSKKFTEKALRSVGFQGTSSATLSRILKETVEETASPLIRRGVLHGQKQEIKTVEQMAKAADIDTLVKSVADDVVEEVETGAKRELLPSQRTRHKPLTEETFRDELVTEEIKAAQSRLTKKGVPQPPDTTLHPAETPLPDKPVGPRPDQVRKGQRGITEPQFRDELIDEELSAITHGTRQPTTPDVPATLHPAEPALSTPKKDLIPSQATRQKKVTVKDFQDELITDDIRNVLKQGRDPSPPPDVPATVVKKTKVHDIPPRAPRKSETQLLDAFNASRRKAGLPDYTIRKLLNDIDTVVFGSRSGERGSFSLFGQKQSKTRSEAAESILQNIHIVQKNATKAGKDVAQFLLDSGVDATTVRNVVRELTDLETVAKTIKFGDPAVTPETASSQEIREANVTLGKVYSKPIGEKDLKWFEHATTPPHWLVKKYPRLQKIYEITRQRLDARAETSKHYLEKVDDFIKLKKKDYEVVKGLLINGDEKGIVYTAEELLQKGLTPEATKAYLGVRKVLDDIHNHYWKALYEYGIPEDEILKAQQQMNEIVGYFPRMRKGKYFIKAEKAGEAPVRYHYNSGFQGNKLKKDLIRQGYKLTEEGSTAGLPNEVYFDLSPEAISAVFESATKQWDEVARAELRDNLTNVLKERGFGQHRISRRGELIKGYETDNLKQVLYDYINGFSGLITKMKAGNQYANALAELAFQEGKVGAKEIPGQYKYARKYVRDMMENADAMDRISGQLRAAFFFKYLGGIFKSGVVNATQNFVAAAPRLSLETKHASLRIMEGMKDIVGHYAAKGNPKKSPLKPDEIVALRLAIQKGWTQDQYFKELMGHMAKYGGTARKIQDAAGFFMSTFEKYNRQSTFLASYRAFRGQAKQLGKTGDDAFQWAIKKAGGIVDNSHFVYGKANLPGAFRGSSVRKLARTGYTFRTFTHNYLNLLSEMSGRKGGKIAIAKSVATIGALGGVSALPFIKSTEAILQRSGLNPRGAVKKWGDQYGLVDDLMLYGLPGLVGIDLGGSIGIEAPGYQAFKGEDLWDGLKDTAVDIIGVPGAIAEDAFHSMEQIGYGDYYRATEESPFTPQLVAQAMKAYREQKEGRTTLTGRPIFSEEDPSKVKKPTKGEAVLRGAFGFQTTKASEDYRVYSARRAEKVRWDKKKNKLRTQLRKAINKHGFGSNEVEKASEAIRKFNVDRPEYVAPIDMDDTLKQMRGEYPSFRDQMLMEKVQ